MSEDYALGAIIVSCCVGTIAGAAVYGWLTFGCFLLFGAFVEYCRRG